MSRILDYLETIKHKLTTKEYDKLQNRIVYLEQVEKDFKQLKSKHEKEDKLLTKIKDILALSFSYQEIGIKIVRLFWGK